MCLKIIDNPTIQEMPESLANEVLNKIIEHNKNCKICWEDMTDYTNYNNVNECYYYMSPKKEMILYFTYNVESESYLMYAEVAGYTYTYDEKYHPLLKNIYDFMSVIVRDSNYVDVEYTLNDNEPFEFKENINYNYEYLGLL